MQEPIFKKVFRDERQEECRKKWILNKCRGTIVPLLVLVKLE